MGLPLALYYLSKGARSDKSALDQNDMALRRPDGQMVWLHAPRPADHPIVLDLIMKLSEQNAKLSFLVTSDDAGAIDWPNNCIVRPVPQDTRSAVGGFLSTWAPDLAAWLGDELRPGLISKANANRVPIYLLDTGNAHAVTQFHSRIPGLRRSVLRRFNRILAGDESTAKAFRRAGASENQILTTGVLERGIKTLDCLEAERDTLAHLFEARPVWLAAELHSKEFDAVLTAHETVLRRTHRLLLIVVPSNLTDTPTLAKLLTERDISFDLRSTGAEPEAETQVYVADTDGEMGLWYRLAPTSFVGHTLVETSEKGPHPFNAAALGSVVLHGPNIDQHRDAFLRLKRANASLQVNNPTELAESIETLLAPDKAAQMAHAAWQICSAGAEATDIVVDLLLEALMADRAVK